MRISWFASASQPLLPSPLRRRNDGWGRLCTPHPHPVHRGEGMTDRGLCCLGLTALCPLDERRDIAACYRKAPDCQVFFEHQRWFIRSSLTEIPSRPFRTIHRGEGMTDGGLCCLGLTALCPLDERRDYRCLLQKSTRLPGFFELQRHFIRSSLPEIPSRPFRTIHRGEGMTDGGLYPPHPHPVHRGEGMTDRGLCCLGLTALCPLDERRDIAACYRKAPDCQVFFEHQRWFIRSSLTEIPSRPFRTIHCGEGMTDGGGFVLPIPPAVVLWTKGEISMLATEKHATARVFSNIKGASSDHRWQRFLLGHSARSTAAKE
jgi:hypothetical protein